MIEFIARWTAIAFIALAAAVIVNVKAKPKLVIVPFPVQAPAEKAPT